LKRNLISYNKFIKLQPFIIVFVDVSATETSTKAIIKDCNLMNLL